MAKTKRIKDGQLETTDTPDVVISTFTWEEVVGKIAEAQTKIDHLAIDTTKAETEKAEWMSSLEMFDE